MKSIAVSLNLSLYRKELDDSIDKRLSSLRNVLRSLEDESFGIKAQKINPSKVLHLQLANNNIDPSEHASEEILNAFNSIMRSFVDFLDKLIAARDVLAKTKNLKATRPLKGIKEILDYSKEYLDNLIKQAIAKVAADSSLNNTSKISKFNGLSEKAKRCALGFFTLRRSIEHHKSIANKDFTLFFCRMNISVNGIGITKMPFKVNGGEQVQMEFGQVIELRFKKGEKVRISEEILENIILTLKLIIVNEIMRATNNVNPQVS